MKKQLFACLAALLLTTPLVGCNNNNTSNSTPTESESSVVNPSVELEYKLEDGETYNPFNVSYDSLTNVGFSTMSISGFASLVVDPFAITYFGSEVSVKEPTAELLQGKTILYTSAWYHQNTFKRSDDVIEYVLLKEMGVWYVSDIKDSSETFIPFNGAVLSVPKSYNKKLNKTDIIEIKNDSIPTYQLGLYNQDGKRLAVRTANSTTFAEEGINLYDNNVIGEVTRSQWVKVASLNCYYDDIKQSYIVDRFRLQNKNGKVYTNVNDGFMLASAIKSTRDNVTLFEGVRFNKGDTLKVETGSAIHDKTFTFVNRNTNSYTLSDGKTYQFSVEKSSSLLTTNRWGWEVAVDNNDVIIDHGVKVDFPKGGYKFVVKAAGNSGAEDINRILEECFARGSQVSMSGNNIYINSSTQRKNTNFSAIVKDYLDETLKDVETFNYSYDVDALNECKEQLNEVIEEIDSSFSSMDPTIQYRLSTLNGSLYQIYYDILSATNRNEAAQVKASWYIVNFNNEDNNLQSIIKNLTKLKNSGINEIIVSPVEDGKAYYSNSEIFEMDNAVKSKNYGEYGNNYVKAITSEAHKLGIKVFANFTPFTNGLEKEFDLDDAWALSITGNKSVVTSQGKVQMLDPANEKVIEAIKSSVNDILKCNPELDGFHLDYIRFGADNSYKNTVMGVTEAARVGFNKWASQNNYSYSFNSLQALRSGLNGAAAFSAFNQYQQFLITDTVRYIKEECKKYDQPLTAAVADDHDYVKTWKCQSWGEWAKLGYVDALYLMDYYFDEYYINYYFEDMVKNTNNSTLLVTGIDPSYANLTDEYYARTIKGGINNVDSHGYSIFGTHTQNAKKDGWDLIEDSNWIDSLSVYDELNKTMKASGDLLLSRCDKIYMTYNNQSQAQKDQLQADLEALYALVTNENYDSATAAYNHLKSMKEKTYASNEAENRIDEQLDYMIKIVKMKMNIYKD